MELYQQKQRYNKAKSIPTFKRRNFLLFLFLFDFVKMYPIYFYLFNPVFFFRWLRSQKLIKKGFLC